LFVAAPRIVSWLMKHTEANRYDLIQDPIEALPRFLAAFFGLASVFLGLGTARTVLLGSTITPWVTISAVVMIMVACGGAIVFIIEYSRDPRGSTMLLVIAIAWLEAAIAYFVGSGGVEFTSLIMAAIAFAFWVVMLVIARNAAKEAELQ
jgi:hypothetical protein